MGTLRTGTAGGRDRRMRRGALLHRRVRVEPWGVVTSSTVLGGPGRVFVLRPGTGCRTPRRIRVRAWLLRHVEATTWVLCTCILVVVIPPALARPSAHTGAVPSVTETLLPALAVLLMYGVVRYAAGAAPYKVCAGMRCGRVVGGVATRVHALDPRSRRLVQPATVRHEPDARHTRDAAWQSLYDNLGAGNGGGR